MTALSRLDRTRLSRSACLGALVVLALSVVTPAASADAQDAETTIGADIPNAVFPGAESVGAFIGDPPAAPAYAGGAEVGYVFSTRDVVGSVGFSGKPIDILVGLRSDGRIAGTYLRHHSEPILIIGIPDARLRRYVADFAGLDVRARLPTAETETEPVALPDAISGATISSLVIRDAVLRSARAVARTRGLVGAEAADARLDRESFATAGWGELLGDGSIVRLRLTHEDVTQAFRARGVRLATVPGATPDPQGVFIDLYAGLLTPPRVGQNLLGKLAFNRLLAELGPNDHAILVAANGLYSYKGTAFVRTGLFDRIQIVQGDKTIRLTEEGYRNVERLRGPDPPEMREVGVFIIQGDTGFDPLSPWRLELLVGRETAQAGLVYVAFPLEYRLPERYRIEATASTDAVEARPAALDGAAGGTALWRQIWRERIARIAVLGVILAALTAILVFQDAVVRDRRFYRTVRLAFLAVTLVWLGWYAGAQLSVINVITFAHSLLTEFHWEFFLLEPLIFILWSYVAVAMLFWGRGVFCGWLCPFGALQELLNEGARALRVPQIGVPFGLHERLWPIKYIIFLGLFAVSLHSTNLAVVGAEVEPFKTAISLKFLRHWPFVVYVLALLALGLFVERAFCRYLCPLGAALAIPARLRMFDWLKRRHQCGRECHICAVHCTVQAIHPNGAINPNECVHCLNCQALYHDDRTCPPLIARRKRREERAARKAARQTAGEGGTA